MQGVIIAFLAVVSVICLFAVLVVVWEIVREARGRRADSVAPPSGSPPVAPVAPSEPIAPVASIAPQDDTAAALDKSAVVFSASAVETLEQRYLKLPAQSKAYYDELARYAANVENARRFKTARYEEYRVGKTRLVRLSVRRGAAVGEFILMDRDLRTYIAENKLRVKPAPIVIRLTDDSALLAAKQSIDIVVQQMAEEKAYRKQLANERRKAARARSQPK